MLDFLIWFSVNIFVPVILPFLLLLVPKMIENTEPYAKGLIIKAVQDGQLFWLTVALSAVGIYELCVYLQLATSTLGRITAVIGIIALAILWFLSILLAVLHALNLPSVKGSPAPAASEEGIQQPVLQESASQQRAPDMGMVKTSRGFLTIAALIATVGHCFAASVSNDAILVREAKWQAYAKCLTAREPNVQCNPPEGTSK